MKKIRLFLILHFLIFSVYNMGHPVTPQFLKEINSPTYMTGILLATMGLAQFLFAPIVGKLSDKYGRYILFIGPLGYAVGQLGFVIFDNTILLIIFRFIAGLFSVMNVSINVAYLSDIAKKGEEKKILGYGSLCLPLAVFLGFILGGNLGVLINVRYVFLVQAILSIMLAVLTYYIVKDAKNDLAKQRQTKIQFSIFKNSINTLKKYNKTPLVFILFITLLNVLSVQLLASQIAQQLTLVFKMPTSFIGTYIATISLISGLLGIVFQNKIFRMVKNSEKLLPLLSSLSTLACIISYIALPNYIYIFWFCVLGATFLNTIFVTVVQDIIVRLNKNNDRGELLGLNQSSQALGVVAGNLGAGFAFSISPFLPILLSIISFFLTALYNIFIVVKVAKR